MVITPDFGSSNVGSIPAGTTMNALLVQWTVHESSKLRMIVRFYQGVHFECGFFFCFMIFKDWTIWSVKIG